MILHIKRVFTFSLFIIGALSIQSCSDNGDAEAQLQADINIIEKYIEDNNLNAIELEAGLYLDMEKPGLGKQVQRTSSILIKYRGYLTDGTQFDESWNSPAQLNLPSLIEGWKRALPEFREGGKGTILIASGLGYGNQQNNTIPANSVLIFDVEIITVY